MIDYLVVSLIDATDIFGLDKVNESFKSFTCSEEKDLEDFLLNKAVDYKNAGKGKTFLLIDSAKTIQEQTPVIVAYYTLANTAIDLSNFGENKKKKVVGDFPNRDQRNSFPAFLIGQLGRDSKYDHNDLSGEIIVKEAFHTLKSAADIVGGKLVVLECREHMYDKVYSKLGFKKLDNELNSDGLYMLYSRIDFNSF